MGEVKITPFSLVYDKFFTLVTDDMYLSWNFLDTFKDLQNILLNAIVYFEFPRFDITDYEIGSFDYICDYCGVSSNFQKVPATGWVGGNFNTELSNEEITVIATYMVTEWFKRQLATTQNTKMLYSGSDFKLTSQANHMAKLKVMIDKWEADGKHLQRLYARRILVDGQYKSTVSSIMS